MKRGTPPSAGPGSWPRRGRVPTAAGSLPGGGPTGRAGARPVQPLGRLNPLGLNLFAARPVWRGTRGAGGFVFVPPIICRNEEAWCQLFSEPGAGLDLASLHDEGRARWRRLAHQWSEGVDHVGARLGLGRAARPRTDVDVPKRQGLTSFLIDLPAPAWCGGPPAPPPRRRGRLQRGVPQRGPGPRRLQGRCRGCRVEGRRTPRCRGNAGMVSARGRVAWTASEARAWASNTCIYWFSCACLVIGAIGRGTDGQVEGTVW